MRKCLDFLASTKFAIIITALILILALIGSFIPQTHQEDNINEHVLAFMQIIGFDNIFSSVFFIILIVLFAINLILCTIKLLPFARKQYKDIDNLEFHEEKRVVMNYSYIKDFFRNNKFNITEQDNIIVASKYALGRYSVIILHTAILIILLGAGVGHFFGFKGFMNILEGSDDNVIVLSSGEFIPLGFEVHLNRFDIEYYDNTSRPKSFKSTIELIHENNTLLNKVIDVNSPLEHNGITFYQYSYGFYPSSDSRFLFTLVIDNKSKDFEIPFEQSFKINNNIFGKITDFAPTLAVNPDNTFTTKSEEMVNPAMLAEFYNRNGDPLFRSWISNKNISSGDFTNDHNFRIIFDKLYGIQYTGLSVKKDPGKMIVYLGFILMSLSLLMIYLINYTVIVVHCMKDNDTGEMISYKIYKQRRYSYSRVITLFKKFVSSNENLKG